MFLNLFQPSRDVIEGLLFSDIIHQDNPIAALVVSGRDGFESLLAGGVPNVELEFLIIY